VSRARRFDAHLDERDELFAQLVLQLGVPRARMLIEVVAKAVKRERQDRHNERERPKHRAKRGPNRQHRGFAAMDPDRVREISVLGGRAARDQGNAHRYTRSEARAAGSKGGLAKAKNMRRHSTTARSSSSKGGRGDEQRSR